MVTAVDALAADGRDVLTSGWPSDGLESLGACPICGSPARELLFSGLRDRIFRCAPGSWDLHACRDCGTGYLDPRPTSDTIHLAYQTYYTHKGNLSLPADQLRGRRWLERVLANGYKNWKFGTDLQPSSRLGVLVTLLVPSLRSLLDRQFRHLPTAKRNGRVLDIGFGDAGFLENARAMGWTVVGTDLDPKVVEDAKRRGFDARVGTLEGVEGPFDAITMCHVIEHLHDPVAVLRTCHSLLAPGGTIWLETPNLGASGLREFGPYWRGLEPPRHLVLFNRDSIARALEEAGFTEVRDLRQPSVVWGMYVDSTRIRNGEDPYAAAPVSRRLKLQIKAVTLLEWIWKRRREFLAVTARKVS